MDIASPIASLGQSTTVATGTVERVCMSLAEEQTFVCVVMPLLLSDELRHKTIKWTEIQACYFPDRSPNWVKNHFYDFRRKKERADQKELSRHALEERSRSR